jgi:hypothetical protein
MNSQEESITTILSPPESIKVSVPNISVEISKPMDTEVQKMLNELLELVTETSRKYVQALEDALKNTAEDIPEDNAKASHISERMKDFMREKNLLYPSFRILGEDEAKQFLEKNGYRAEKIFSDQLLLVFNLPKPLARYWWKGTLSDNFENAQTKETVAEWGKLYERTIYIAWEMEQDAINAGLSLHFSRVNGYGIHDVSEFYYIWKVQATSFLGPDDDLITEDDLRSSVLDNL